MQYWAFFTRVYIVECKSGWIFYRRISFGKYHTTRLPERKISVFLYRTLLFNLYFWCKTPEMTNNEISIEQINKLDAAAFRLLYKNYYKALVCYAIQLSEIQNLQKILSRSYSPLFGRKRCFSGLWLHSGFICITLSEMLPWIIWNIRMWKATIFRRCLIVIPLHLGWKRRKRASLVKKSIASFFRQLMRCRIDARKFFDVYGRQEERGDCHCTPCFSWNCEDSKEESNVLP